jgi:hypothetical protein
VKKRFSVPGRLDPYRTPNREDAATGEIDPGDDGAIGGLNGRHEIPSFCGTRCVMLPLAQDGIFDINLCELSQLVASIPYQCGFMDESGIQRIQ